jgi:hypothetical protein
MLWRKITEICTVFCRVFSDGGNFCPEEIDVYRKKLENMSSKIDVSEGAIMSDMEDIEKKRLDQATKVASEFEDRYQKLYNRNTELYLTIYIILNYT